MSESVLDTWERWILGPRLQGFGDASRHNRSTYNYVNGSVVVLGGLDHPERLYSTEWDLVCIFEAIEALRDEYERFGRGMSGNHIPLEILSPDGGWKPVLRDGKPVHRTQIIMDTNPENPGHWLNTDSTLVPDGLGRVNTLEDWKRLQRWNLRKPVVSLEDAPDASLKMPIHRLLSRHQDNPRFWDRDKWGWTPDGEAVVLRELASMTGHRRARLFEGRWVAAEGAVFPEFDESVHVVDDFVPPAPWPWYVGWDPGYAHPTGIPWVVVAPNQDLYVGDEIYEGGKSVQEHAEECLRRCAGRTVRRWFGDPHEFFSTRAQGKSCQIQARQAGLPIFIPWANQRKGAMVNELRQLLINTVKGNGRKIFIMRKCRNVVMEFQSWAFKRNADGQLAGGSDDAYEDANNHLVGDPLVGMVSTGLMRYFPVA